MISEQHQEIPISSQLVKYFYIIIGQYETIRLEVDNKDVIVNADGVLDCPFDTVLRKNNFTFEDLNTLSAREIQFSVISGGKEEILQSIPLNVNL